MTPALASNTNGPLETSEKGHSLLSAISSTSNATLLNNNTNSKPPIVLNLQSKTNDKNTSNRTNNITLNNKSNYSNERSSPSSSSDAALLSSSSLCNRSRKLQNIDTSISLNLSHLLNSLKSLQSPRETLNNSSNSNNNNSNNNSNCKLPTTPKSAIDNLNLNSTKSHIRITEISDFTNKESNHIDRITMNSFKSSTSSTQTESNNYDEILVNAVQSIKAICTKQTESENKLEYYKRFVDCKFKT